MRKLFRTYDSGVINSCISTVSERIDQRKVIFLSKCRSNLQENLLCKICQSQ